MEELSRSLRSFVKVMEAATVAHRLVPNEFDWLLGKVRHPMEPQPILASGYLTGWPWHIEAIDHDYFTSTVTVYGGKITNREGDFQYGYVSGHIAEPMPPGVKHQSNQHDPPVPYIARVLTVKNNVITVRTPEKDHPVGQGPVVFEGMNGGGRWATVTCYDLCSNKLTVRSGDFVTDGQGWFDDHTVAQDAYQFPRVIVEARVATMIRTLDSAADILNKVASHGQAEWSISLHHTSSYVR